jgi:hypothetical protein
MMCAWSWLLLMNVVVRELPFHSTVDAGTKAEPWTVSVKANPPAAALPGDSVVIVGTGFGVGVGVGAGVGVGVGEGGPAEPEAQPTTQAQIAKANIAPKADLFQLLSLMASLLRTYCSAMAA